MARNIEIKATARNFAAQCDAAKHIADAGPEVLHQVDTFFNVPQGRLKLREFPDAPAQLIYYTRDNQAAAKLSDYHISESPDGAELKKVLSLAYGVRQVVRKSRTLFLRGRTRIHLDQVENLGEFIELEVVLSEHDSLPEARVEANDLMQQLNIQECDLLESAYVDLLEEKQCL